MIKSHRKKTYQFFLVVLLFVSVLSLPIRSAYLDYYTELNKTSDISNIDLKPKVNEEVIDLPEPVVEKQKINLPLSIPFTSQAPFGIWDILHQEACEEASILMVYYYLNGRKLISPTEADTDIKKFIAWQESNGYKVDLTIKEVVAVGAAYFKMKGGRVITSPTIEQIKNELELGNPVIIPAAGRELKNPYFTPPGPIYHMLVIKGYDETGFITNDPGTKRGESYHYSFDVLMNALHDWNSTNILEGSKGVVVFDR